MPARLLIAICCCLLLWNAGYAMELISPTLQGKLFYSNVQWLGIVFVSPFWLILTAVHTGIKAKTYRWFWLGLVIPILTVGMILTDGWHHLFRQSLGLSNQAGFEYFDPTYGPWFWYVYLPHAYLLLTASLAILLLSLNRRHAIFRRQTVAMILSLILPITIDLANIGHVFILQFYDLTPSTMSLSSLMIGYALFRYGMLRVVPLAHDMVFEQMSDGVVVLDDQGLLVDYNPAAGRVLDLRIGESPNILPISIKRDAVHEPSSRSGFSIGEGENQRFFEARVSPVRDHDHHLIGWAILLRDNTQNQRLMAQLERFATIDPLTEVLNRRRFMDIFHAELSRSERYVRPLSLLMMDLDHFKLVNDTHGHLAGDQALKDITRICRESLREVDRIGRYGGEEFAIILPETETMGAVITAERLRQRIEALRIRHDTREFVVTASFGVATFSPGDEPSLEKIIHAADSALYQAKNNGRNRVEKA